MGGDVRTTCAGCLQDTRALRAASTKDRGKVRERLISHMEELSLCWSLMAAGAQSARIAESSAMASAAAIGAGDPFANCSHRAGTLDSGP
jgi:hypothetical protein